MSALSFFLGLWAGEMLALLIVWAGYSLAETRATPSTTEPTHG